jgi:hypothetical protein
LKIAQSLPLLPIMAEPSGAASKNHAAWCGGAVAAFEELGDKHQLKPTLSLSPLLVRRHTQNHVFRPRCPLIDPGAKLGQFFLGKPREAMALGRGRHLQDRSRTSSSSSPMASAASLWSSAPDGHRPAINNQFTVNIYDATPLPEKP